jgi:magnesium chelatase accessory protein
VSGARLSWSADGADWPNRQQSAFVTAGGLTWHTQRLGKGPKLLLLHGTGASTHSFRDLAPLLAGHFELLAPDLPGHAFTDMPAPAGLSLPGMARLVGALLAKLDFRPEMVVGHSAGAAILIEMALDRLVQPAAIVSLNGALVPIRGASLFSPLAKLLFLNPLVPRLFAWRALSHDATRRVMDGTGSTLDRRGLELYQRLFRSPNHVSGTLGMMANWDLHALQSRIRTLDVRLVLVSAANDRAIPPGDADIIARPGPQRAGRPPGGWRASRPRGAVTRRRQHRAGRSVLPRRPASLT